jgi:hypothetical protein
MRILIDESLDPDLRLHVRDVDEAFSAEYCGWKGLKNGALLKAADEAAFNVLLTRDQGIPREQNLKAFALAIIVLVHHDQKRYVELMPRVRQLLDRGVLPQKAFLIEAE